MILINNILYTLTVLSQILIAVLLLAFIFKRKQLISFFKNHSSESKYLALAVSLGATLGSLFYSEIASFTPCVLCWYQRIFMYPIPILLGVGIFFKDNIRKSVIVISTIGGLIALYHYVVQMSTIVSCSVDGVDCSIRYLIGFGYITIPLMALTAFTLIALLTYFNKK